VLISFFIDFQDLAAEKYDETDIMLHRQPKLNAGPRERIDESVFTSWHLFCRDDCLLGTAFAVCSVLPLSLSFSFATHSFAFA